MLKDTVNPTPEGQAVQPRLSRRMVISRGVQTAALMGILTLAGCAASDANGSGAAPTPIPYTPPETPTVVVSPTAVPVVPTETPQAPSGSCTVTSQDICFTPGVWQCHSVPAYSVAQGDFYWNGSAQFDNNPETGAIGKILQSGTACTEYGGDIIVTNKNNIDQVVGQAIDDMSQKGCDNNQGCPQGITVWVYGK